MLQKTLDGELVPVAPHRDDEVICSDGWICKRSDAFFDCRDGAHHTEEEKNEANDDIVRELLDTRCEWAGEYVESDDYGDAYAYLVFEDCIRWKREIEEFVESECSTLVSDIVYDLMGEINEYDIEAKFQRSEYAAYYGEGVCLDSFPVEEYEDQINVKECEEFKALYERSELQGCLDRYNGDLCVVVDKYSLRGDYPCFYGYSSGWGCWHYVLPLERARELLAEVIVDWCRRNDRKGQKNT